MKTMAEVVKIALSGICLSAIAGAAYAGPVCTCEDWNNNGSFGVVLYQAAGAVKKSVIDGNVGKYDKCMSFKSKLSMCKATKNICMCEDWDKDGRFGAVVYMGVNKKRHLVKGDVGNYYDCIASIPSLKKCK